MPLRHAQKPGDLQTACRTPDKPGKTIEIINTDAEGRLVRPTGCTYARQLGATHLIDAATLTGAISVALGKINAGGVLKRRWRRTEIESARRSPAKILADAAGRSVCGPD